jgi:hypothetical protein
MVLFVTCGTADKSTHAALTKQSHQLFGDVRPQAEVGFETVPCWVGPMGRLQLPAYQ